MTEEQQKQIVDRVNKAIAKAQDVALDNLANQIVSQLQYMATNNATNAQNCKNNIAQYLKNMETMASLAPISPEGLFGNGTTK